MFQPTNVRRLLLGATRLGLFLVVLANCGGGDESTGPVPVATVTVSPPTASLLIGQTQQLTATLEDGNGSTLTDRTVAWSTSNGAVASVSTTGLVTALGGGAATVTASSEGKSGTASMTVTVPVSTVTVSPATTSMPVGATQQLIAVTKDAGGNTLAGRAVAWSTSNATVASVSTTGLVTALVAGPATITATSEGKSGAASVTSKGFTSLSNDVAVGLPAIAAGDAEYYTITVPAGRFTLRVNVTPTLGGTASGDPNLAVYGSTSLGTPVCSANLVGADECNLASPAPATYAISVRASAAVSGYEVRAATYSGQVITQTLVVGGSHTCVLSVSGDAACWGHNTSGQLGDGSNIHRLTLVPVTGGLSFTSLTAGGDHTCGLVGSGSAYCWGYNLVGQLGDSTYLSHSAPAPTHGGLTFSSLTGGPRITCGLSNAGAPYCWGRYPASSPIPTLVPGGLTFASIRAGGDQHVCALTTADAGYCWGEGDRGMLGDGTQNWTVTPVPVAGGLAFHKVSPGLLHTCGVTTGAAAYCWGYNQSGELGDGTTMLGGWRLTPGAVGGGLVFSSLQGGTAFTCGLTISGQAYCWGYNLYGQLGDGTTTDRSTPTLVTGGLVFQSIGVGSHHACGQTFPGAIYCWGSNSYGQLGDGTTTERHQPVPALVP